jgi:hypothetical protein
MFYFDIVSAVLGAIGLAMSFRAPTSCTQTIAVASIFLLVFGCILSLAALGYIPDGNHIWSRF